MENRNMWPLVIGVIAVVAIIAWVATRHEAETQPTSALGNVVEGIGDKLDQAGNQIKADANASSADANFDAAKEKLGIEPSSNTTTE